MKSLSRVRLLVTPWTAAYQLLRPWDFPGKIIGVGCHCLLRHKEWLVPNPLGGMGHGTIRKQHGSQCGKTRADWALWLWAPRWEGKHCPGTGKGARCSQRRDSGKLPLITRSALTILWRLTVFDCGWHQHPALHLVSLFCGPPTCTLGIQPGRRSSENSQPWCLSGPS